MQFATMFVMVTITTNKQGKMDLIINAKPIGFLRKEGKSTVKNEWVDWRKK
jgi:hypothetical protein